MNGPGCTSPTLCLLRALGCLLLLFFNKPSCLAQATGIPSVSGARNVSATKTELGIKGARFTIDGKSTFLYGISYYGALGASEGFIRSDLDDMHRHGFNWIRVWANWRAFGADAAAVDGEGRRIPAGLKKLKWLLTECDRRGLVVDVTFSRGNSVNGTPQLQTLDAHRRAVETVVTALKPRRNWYLDLSNERNVQDKRFTGIDDLKQLRELAVRLDPDLLVTASDGGDITWDSLREYLQTVKVDFISPHRPRDARFCPGCWSWAASRRCITRNRFGAAMGNGSRRRRPFSPTRKPLNWAALPAGVSTTAPNATRPMASRGVPSI
ncbi:MAG: hypothetical protein DME19_20330 [Verrucomicrobia bacterium]|nr:MAG: hypothetical protein DME19_20330 [Verrucomicrobiota bacterium]